MILNSMERIIKEILDNLDPGLATDLIQQAAKELTQSKVGVIMGGHSLSQGWGL